MPYFCLTNLNVEALGHVEPEDCDATVPDGRTGSAQEVELVVSSALNDEVGHASFARSDGNAGVTHGDSPTLVDDDCRIWFVQFTKITEDEIRTRASKGGKLFIQS